jgi:hypothetical protein
MPATAVPVALGAPNRGLDDSSDERTRGVEFARHRPVCLRFPLPLAPFGIRLPIGPIRRPVGDVALSLIPLTCSQTLSSDEMRFREVVWASGCPRENVARLVLAVVRSTCLCLDYRGRSSWTIGSFRPEASIIGPCVAKREVGALGSEEYSTTSLNTQSNPTKVKQSISSGCSWMRPRAFADRHDVP